VEVATPKHIKDASEPGKVGSPRGSLASCDAAQITGIDKFVGTLEKGKDADLQFFKGNPIITLEKPQMVFIRGEKVCDRT
jgi:imidazolonepropionase-like amidohydrolase